VVDALGINVPSGIPQLDGSGKILVSQLPNSVMEYKGTWNAATNTPTLVNGTGNQGDVYLCNVAGTVNFGAGAITFAVGDQVIYSGSIWQKAGGSTGTVTSVAVTESGDALTITGSPITTSGTINIGFAGTSGQYVNGAGGLTTFPSLAGYVTAVTGTAPVVSSGGTTPAISMPVATASVDGYLDNADWTTFNNKQNAITLTTTGTSGASTLVGSTLNIPNYSTDLSGYVPYTGATANVDLGTFDLTTDIINLNQLKAIGSGGLNIYSNSGTHIALMGGGGGAGTTFYGGIIGTTGQFTSLSALNSGSGSVSTDFVNVNNQVQIAIRSTGGATYATDKCNIGAISSQGFYITRGVNGGAIFNINTSGTYTYTMPAADGTLALTSQLHDAVTIGTANGLSLSGQVLSLALSSTSTNGALSSTDWNTFNGKQNALTNPITGTGTTNYVPKFTASGTIGNSLIYDTGSRIAIGGTDATYGVLTVQSDSGQFCIQSNTTPAKQLQIGYDHISNNSYLTSLQQGVAFTTLALQPNGGNVHVGGSTSNGARLQVTGTATISSTITGGSSISSGGIQEAQILVSRQFSKVWNLTSDGNGFMLNNLTDGTFPIKVLNGGNVEIGNTGFSSPSGADRFIGVYGGQDCSLILQDANQLWEVYVNDDFYINRGATTALSISRSRGFVEIKQPADTANDGFGLRNIAAGNLWSMVNGGDSNLYFIYNGALRGQISLGTGVYTPLSDINKKKDFEDSTIGLSAILNLKPTLYRMKSDETEGNKELGFIAQEVREFIPQAYIENDNEDKFIGLNYNAIVAALVKSVQELKAEIDELKNK
jgi:hypothetical protein